MKISVKLMKPNIYNSMRANSKKYYGLIKTHPENSDWLKGCFKDDPFETTEYEIEDFELKYDDDYNKYALENGITLYEALKDLPAHILYSRYFWAWINFEKAYRQAIQSVQLIRAQRLENAWFPKYDSHHSIARGTISREFLKVKMSIDESYEDKYALTPYLFNNTSLYLELVSRNVSDNPNFSHAILLISKLIFDKTNKILSAEQTNDLLKTGYKIGSVMLIDSLSAKEIYDIILPRFKKEYPYLFK